MSVCRPILSRLTLAAVAACALAGVAVAADMQAPPPDGGIFVPKARPLPPLVEGRRPPPPPACTPSSTSVAACRAIVPDGCFRRWCPVHLGGGYEPPVCEIYCGSPY